MYPVSSEGTEMSDERTSVSLKKAVRDELRRYKAEDGLTYDEAIARLLSEVDWIGDESELLNKLEND
jgi:hypothetical protein